MNAAPAPREASRRFTSAVLTAGVVLAATCFLLAGVLEMFGRGEAAAGAMTDIGALVAGLTSWSPWAWAALGTYVIVATPVVGLLVTAAEYHAVADRRTVLLALAVAAVLVLSVVVAVLR